MRPHNRYQRDALHEPNPCIAPVESGPFYAIKLVIGDLGTYAGIKTDAHAPALDAAGRVISGLYAADNDMASIIGGNYPGADIRSDLRSCSAILPESICRTGAHIGLPSEFSACRLNRRHGKCRQIAQRWTDSVTARAG